MKTANGKEFETYEEKIIRTARHIRDTNANYKPKSIGHYLKEDHLHCCDVDSILDRISSATRNSRIIVIRNQKGLRCFFAGTVAGWYYLQNKRKEIVGVFDNTMDLNRVRNELMQY